MINEIEKEELFAEFAIRFAEMSKEDKKLKTAKNNSAMKGVTRYWTEVVDKGNWTGNWMWATNEEGRKFFNYWGIYDAYCALRQAIPIIVNLKKNAAIGEGYPQRNDRRKINTLDPETDVEEATKVGKILIDAMLGYLREGEEK